ncbi:MAG TPA: hypothetical protein VOA87_21060, partial [Thermoanaerobaculia bacterium]|nr:hypothetical protein [Thermoanaerobaculia bacterium]
MGFILGIVLTIALEALAVAAGVQGITSATRGGGSGGSPSTPVMACDQYPEDSYEKRTCLETYNRMVKQNTYPE